MTTPREVERLLASAPGPCPWYLDDTTPFIDSRWGPLTWRRLGGDCALCDPSGGTRLLLAMYGFARAIAPRRFLLWFTSESFVRFRAIDVDELIAIEAPEQTLKTMSNYRGAFAWFDRDGSSIAADLDVRTSLAAGSNAVGFPSELQELGDFAFFVSDGSTRLWNVRPASGIIEVFPQDWFEQGDFDRGYAWPTRAARNPASGRFVGAGIRIGAFELDASSRDVSTWIDD